MVGGGVRAEGLRRESQVERSRRATAAPRERPRRAALGARALAGCTSLLAGAPNAIYDLSAPACSRDAARLHRRNVQVLVPEPSTVRALDTDRIAGRPTPSEYAYLPGAVWSDRLPKLLQARLVETLQNSGRVRAVAVPGQGLLIDYQIVLDVRAFELTTEGAVVDFSVRVMDDRNGRVVRSRIFRYVVPVTAAAPPPSSPRSTRRWSRPSPTSPAGRSADGGPDLDRGHPFRPFAGFFTPHAEVRAKRASKHGVKNAPQDEGFMDSGSRDR